MGKPSQNYGEIVFVKPSGRRLQSEPPSVISGLARVESVKMLGVTFSRKLSASSHSMSTISWLPAPSRYLLCEHYDNMDCRTTLYMKCSRR